MKTPAQDIILAPVITEASMAGIALKKYTFKVATNATKVDVARAAEELFGVKAPRPQRGRLWRYDSDNNVIRQESEKEHGYQKV